MSSPNEDQKWVPTHVQVTVLRGRGLRGKGKHGTSDVYTIIQLGKEKYSTCVVEKTTEPEWREECSFELQPGVLESDGWSAYPAGSNELVLTVMHRALIGLDVFLGQAVIQLEKLFLESRCVKNEWYRLNSKTGKKEKERGEIQVTVQFTRNNLTASMYDLVMKDKGASTFSKLKERIRGKRRSSDEDSSSAVLPGGYGSLYRMRHRLPSDGGGEEDYEDDEGGEARRSKMRTFFLRGKLRKSSDTRSSTSLGSESSESSSRGGSLSPTAGISVVVSDLSNSPSNSSNLTVDNSPEHTEDTSPKSSSPRCEYGDETGEITIAVPQLPVCVNRSHAYNGQPQDPGSGKPADSLGLGLLQKTLPLSVSLQNLSPRPPTDLPKGTVGDGRRWSFDKPGDEEKAAIAAALEKSGPMLADEDECLGQTAPLKAPSSSSMAESDSQGKKQKRNLFSHGRSESAGKGTSQSKDESEQASAAAEEKHKGWFGSKDAHSKPSPVMSPKLEPSTHPQPPPLPTSHHPPGPPVAPGSVVSPLHHTNPFCHSQATPPPLSPCNPFFSFLQHNPFYEDTRTSQPLKPLLPPLPYLSSSRPPIAQLFPQASNPNSTLTHSNRAREDSIITGPTLSEEEKHFSKKSPNPFSSAGLLDSDWDDSFEAFASGRLQSPKDLNIFCQTKQNTPHPLEHCYDRGTSLHKTHQNPNVNEHHLVGVTLNSCTDTSVPAHEAVSVVANMHHTDMFTHCLDTIPEDGGFEYDGKVFTSSTNSPKSDACPETYQVNSTTNTNVLTDINMHPCIASSRKLNSSSPDPGSSGLGSSAEEDFLSCFSSYSASDKFSASSSDDTEAQNFESNVLGSEVSTESVINPKQSVSQDDVTDRSNEMSLVDTAEQTVIKPWDGDETVDYNGLEESTAWQSPGLTPQQPVMTGEMASEGAGAQTPNFSNAMYPGVSESDPQPKSNISLSDEEKDTGRFSKPIEFHDAIPDDELCSTCPSVPFRTSSPGGRMESLESTSSGVNDASQDSSFILFDNFLNASHIEISPGLDHTPPHNQVSDQSAGNLLQSLYVSIDSQHYQSCQSHPSSKCSSFSEPSERLQSAHSTLYRDGTEMPTAGCAALGREVSVNGEIGQTEDPCMVEDRRETLELAGPLTDSQTSCNPKFRERVVANQCTLSDDVFLEGPPAQCPPLQRSQSDSTLSTTFEKLFLPSFRSESCALQELSSTQHGSDLSSLTSFASSLTPENRRFPLAFCSLSPLSNTSASSPPTSSTVKAAVPALANANPMPQEVQQQAANQQNSPHPVKPLTAAVTAEEKRSEGRSVLATGLEKLKSTIHPGRSSQPSEQETDRKKSLTEGAGLYYHLTHSELVALLVQREAELERQKAEFQKQKALLAKREVELRRLKPQVRDLEDYIDTLLVRIMEQKPTLLQVRSKLK
ncbi:uncharacterized protein rab11fip5a [Aulostomus maculatus]